MNLDQSYSLRIIGLLTFIASLLCGCVSAPNDSKTPVITNVASDPVGDEQWTLGRTYELHNSDYIATLLVAEKEKLQKRTTVDGLQLSAMEQCGLSFFGLQRCRNILFTNLKKNESRWLFKDNQQFITDFQPSRSGAAFLEFKKESTSRYNPIIYLVVFEDTNDDGVIDGDDSESLAVTRVDGSGFQVLIQHVERLIHHSLTEQDQLAFLYQSGGIGYSMIFDLKTFEISSNVELPRVDE